MIRDLRRKFVAIAMLSVVLVLVFLIGSIDILNYYEVKQNIRSEMSLLKNYDGDLSQFRQDMMEHKPTGEEAEPPRDTLLSSPPEISSGGRDERFSQEFNDEIRRGRISREAPFSLRYFTVSFSRKGKIDNVNVSQIASVSESDARTIATGLYQNTKTEGFYEDYYYATIDCENPDGAVGTKYIFLDCSEDLASFRRFRNISFVVSLIGTGLVFILVWFLSKIAMKPVAESYEKQKHFITDASHEIKTPLAIIEANTEVLEMTEGENEWLSSIRHQISRLSSLTEKLVFLTRMDEESTKLDVKDFSLSHAVEEVAESFLPVAKAKDKQYEIHVDDGIMCCGDEGNLSQAVSLLIDNAMKYSDEGGRIAVSLHTNPKNKKEIKVFNTVDLIEVGKHDEYFERFYRADASRSTKTGGHGIGLSVVKAIATAHKGRVSAESKSATSIEFTITLP